MRFSKDKLSEFISSGKCLKIFGPQDTNHIFLRGRWKLEKQAFFAKPEIYLESKKIFCDFLGFDTISGFPSLSKICSKCHQCCGGVSGDYKKTTCKAYKVEPLLCLNSECLLYLCKPIRSLVELSSTNFDILNAKNYEGWTEEFIKATKYSIQTDKLLVEERLREIRKLGLYPLLF